jgi:DNA-binding FadR family transcriptional regulator
MRMKNSPPSGFVVYWSERTMFAPASKRKPDTALTIPARSGHEMRSRVIAGRSATCSFYLPRWTSLRPPQPYSPFGDGDLERMTTRPVRGQVSRQRKPRLPPGASEQVAADIQRHIQRQGLGANAFLGREEDLASEFGVSRPTLREALKLLASGNLTRATKGPGGGIFVARTAEQAMGRSVEDAIAMMLETGAMTLEELMDARELLEVPLAGRAALHPDGATLERLGRALSAARKAGGDAQAVAALDMDVHRAIAGGSDNPVVGALTGWICEVAQPAVFNARPDVQSSTIIRQHRRLLAAVENGDAARAEGAMRDHLTYIRDALRKSS